MVKMFIKKRVKSIGFACSGIIQFLITEIHAKIHVSVALISIAFSIYLDLNKTDWLLIIIAIGMVLITEMINTAIERLVDIISPEINKNAEFVKDVAAGAVLIAAVISIIIGTVVFTKYL